MVYNFIYKYAHRNYTICGKSITVLIFQFHDFKNEEALDRFIVILQ